MNNMIEKSWNMGSALYGYYYSLLDTAQSTFDNEYFVSLSAQLRLLLILYSQTIEVHESARKISAGPKIGKTRSVLWVLEERVANEENLVSCEEFQRQNRREPRRAPRNNYQQLTIFLKLNNVEAIPVNTNFSWLRPCIRGPLKNPYSVMKSLQFNINLMFFKTRSSIWNLQTGKLQFGRSCPSLSYYRQQ